MMTGVMPSRIGMEANKTGTVQITADMLENSLGRVFAKAGYETVYGGKHPCSHDHGGHRVSKSSKRMPGRSWRPPARSFCVKPHDRPFLLVASFINPA